MGFPTLISISSKLWHHVLSQFVKFQGVTLPKTNMATENRPSQKEINIPTIHFQLAMLVLGWVTFRVSTPTSFSVDPAHLVELYPKISSNWCCLNFPNCIADILASSKTGALVLVSKNNPWSAGVGYVWHLEIASCFRFGFLDVSRQNVSDFEEKNRVV